MLLLRAVTALARIWQVNIWKPWWHGGGVTTHTKDVVELKGSQCYSPFSFIHSKSHRLLVPGSAHMVPFPPTERRMTNAKIDWMIVPSIWSNFCFQLIFRTLLGYNGFQKRRSKSPPLGHGFRYTKTDGIHGLISCRWSQYKLHVPLAYILMPRKHVS
jgi:hypothetical protein